MPMSNSESRKRVAELAAGSDDETPKAPPGYPWPHLPSPVEPGTQPDLRPKSDSCPDFWPDGRHLDPPTEACDCDHPAPVQPPAPDPDETCGALSCHNGTEGCWRQRMGGSDCRRRPWAHLPTPVPPATTCGGSLSDGSTCALPKGHGDSGPHFNQETLDAYGPERVAEYLPPATTGPADETEGLAWLLNAVDWPDGMGDDDYSRRQADAVLASELLAARDAAQQRIGAEKAWDEGFNAGFDTGISSLASAPTRLHDNPYREAI